jgi:hypothetical protein
MEQVWPFRLWFISFIQMHLYYSLIGVLIPQMTKKTKKLEKENSSIKGKCDIMNKNILEMAEEVLLIYIKIFIYYLGNWAHIEQSNVSFPSTFRFITISSSFIIVFPPMWIFWWRYANTHNYESIFIRILQRARDQKAIEDAKKKQAKLVNLCKALQVWIDPVWEFCL